MLAAIALACVWCAAPSWAGTTELISVAAKGAEGITYRETGHPSVSANGRYVAFDSTVYTLVAGDTNGVRDVFVRDRQSGVTERVSVGPGGTQANDLSFDAAISADGRYVAFVSAATNLVEGDTNNAADIFVHDRQTDATERVSVSSNGTQTSGNHWSYYPAISADGRYVAFESYDEDLVPGDTNGRNDIFVHDRQSGVTERVSVSSAGAQANGYSGVPTISANGRFVAYHSDASNLVPGDTNGRDDAFVYDRVTGVVERVSVSTAGTEGDGGSTVANISPDGGWVTFESYAANLVAGDTNAESDIFVHDRNTGVTERVSVASDGTQGDAWSNRSGISAGGQYVAFVSGSSNLVEGDTNRAGDVFLHDRWTGVTERVSVSSEGTQGNGASVLWVAINASGRYIVFESSASNLAPGDTNYGSDVFLRDRLTATLSTAASVAGRIGQTVDLSAELTRKVDGAPIAGETLQFSVDGAAAGSAVTDAAGIATLPHVIAESTGPGPRSITVEYDATATYGDTIASATLSVSKGIPGFSLYAASGAVGQTVTLKSLVLCGGEAVIGRTIQFAVDGTPVGSATSGAGGAALAWKIPGSLTPGTHSVKVSFAGDAAYEAVARTASVLTVRANVLFSLYTASGAAGTKVTLRTLVYSGGSPASGLTVQFAVDGAGVGSGVSDASGAACSYTIPTGMAIGTHNVTVSFVGNSLYNAAARTAPVLTVTVPKASVAFSLSSVSGSPGAAITLKSLVYSGGAPAIGLPVQFSVDGSPVGSAFSAAAGVSVPFTIPLAMAAGPHTVTVSFAGDATHNAATRTAAVLTVK